MKMIRQKKFENIKVVPNQIGSIPIKILVDFQKDHLAAKPPGLSKSTFFDKKPLNVQCSLDKPGKKFSTVHSMIQRSCFQIVSSYLISLVKK